MIPSADLYLQLLQKPIFRISDVAPLYGSLNSARAAVKRLVGRGYALKIRNDMYTCLNRATGWPAADRFQVASAISPGSYVSHHSAMEFYGIMDQFYYDVYVSSDSKFNDFEFDGFRFKYLRSSTGEGIDHTPKNGTVSVTCIERTVIDSIRDIDKVAGVEEVVSNIESIDIRLNEDALLKYLDLYRNMFLYQKTALLLEHCQEQLGLSNRFFDECLKRSGKSCRYLSRDMMRGRGRFNRRWSLVIPENLFNMKNGPSVDAFI